MLQRKLLLENVDLYLSNSSFTWKRFLEFNPRLANRAHRVVHLGCGEPLGHSQLPDSSGPYALIISRMLRSEDYKGHKELIKAWPRVIARIPDAELWIVGDGDLRPELEALAAATGVGGRIRFWGRVEEGRKQELLRDCRCLVMPSRGEGFGLVYLEAMRLGKPCLVSTNDAGREVVNPPEAGLAVDPEDSDALADSVCRLLSPGDEWSEWSRRAETRYRTYFTESHFKQRLIEAVF